MAVKKKIRVRVSCLRVGTFKNFLKLQSRSRLFSPTTNEDTPDPFLIFCDTHIHTHIYTQMSLSRPTRGYTAEPTALHILSNKLASTEEAEQIITAYLDAAESSSALDAAAEAAIAANSNSTLVDSLASALTKNENTLNQLKRVQRSLRGLPPVLQSDQPAQTYSTFQNADTLNEPEFEEAELGSKRKISAEERKRLKKERRKTEKRSKAMEAAKNKDNDESDDDNDDDN